MIAIDGALGEGGGQVMRTSLALSAITGQEVIIENIRKNRPKPGLKQQHLTAVKAVAELCGAEVEGAAIGSQRVVFKPDEIKSGKIKYDIGTAGSITLLLQTVMPVAAFAPDKVVFDIVGGTDVLWSPPVDYLRNVLLPMLGKVGYRAELDVVRRGFYPVGGGRVRFTVRPGKLNGIELVEAGMLRSIKGVSYAAQDLKGAQVAERQANSVVALIWNEFNVTPKIAVEYSETACPGSGIVLWLEYENSIVGASALGERGKRSEAVGKEAFEALKEQKGLAVDEHLGDQLVPYLALAGGESSYRAKLTGHLETNLKVVEQFGAKASFVDVGNGTCEITIKSI